MKQKLIIASIVILLLVAAAVFYIQKTLVSTADNLNLPNPVVTQTHVPNSVVPVEDSGPEIIFEAEGSITPDDKSELINKIIEPFVDYHTDSTGSGNLLTLTISPNMDSNKATYPFIANAIFDSGVALGFVIERSDTSFNYWQPECMGDCPFTDSFRAKYPQIANP